MIRHLSPAASTRSRASSSLPIAAATAARFSAGSANHQGMTLVTHQSVEAQTRGGRNQPRELDRGLRRLATPVRFIPRSTSTSTPIVVPASLAAWPRGATWSWWSTVTLTSAWRWSAASRAALLRPTTRWAIKMSSIPPAAMTSASETLATVTPIAPAAAQEVGDRRALERLGVGTPRDPSRPEVARHQVDVVLEQLEVDQESRRIELAHRQADRAELHGGRSLASAGVSRRIPRQTCDGISKRLLYSRESSESAWCIVERLESGVEGELLAGAEGDVSQVAQPGAQVADFDVGIGLLAALDAIEKVLHVDVPGRRGWPCPWRRRLVRPASLSRR